MMPHGNFIGYFFCCFLITYPFCLSSSVSNHTRVCINIGSFSDTREGSYIEHKMHNPYMLYKYYKNGRPIISHTAVWRTYNIIKYYVDGRPRIRILDKNL